MENLKKIAAEKALESIDPIVLFKRFRGRGPKIDALLKYNGIT